MNGTSIEWTDRTWNPVTGCTRVSPGCERCYAESIARRFAGTPAFPRGFEVVLHEQRVAAPLLWRRPARVFVNSMSDLFHTEIPDEFIARVFAVMAATPQHTYQILTKRHGRMRSLLSDPGFEDSIRESWDACREAFPGKAADPVGRGWYPLSNVWLGVSVEDQKRAELRVPALLDTPAAVRFLSCEPLLGPIDLSPWVRCLHDTVSADRCEHCGASSDEIRRDDARPVGPGLGWVIVGGESGPGARCMNLRWARQLVGRCRAGLVPVFVKQLGSAAGPRKGSDMTTWPPALRVRQYPANRRQSR
jgi:protein gp37